MAVAFLKERSLGRIVAGHPWVYESDIARMEKAPGDGEEITVRTGLGKYVGNGFYNSKSRIPIRIFSRSREKLDEGFFRKRILEAKALRENSTDFSSAHSTFPERLASHPEHPASPSALPPTSGQAHLGAGLGT